MEMKDSNVAREHIHDAGGHNQLPRGGSDPDAERPTYTRMSRRYLAIEVLDKYRIDYMLDAEDPDFVVIKRWVPEHEQDFLWFATNRLRERLDYEMNKRSQSIHPHPIHPTIEPQVVEASLGKRDVRLDLKINRIPFEKWLEFRDSDKRGKHVLDVAMSCNQPAPVPDNIATEASEPVDPSAEEPDAVSVPVRLAINSSHVAHELSRIADMGIRPGRNVIIPPWKPLVTYREAIIERFQTLKQLQSEWDATKVSKENRPSARGSGESPTKETSPNQRQKISVPDFGDNYVLEPCEICELYPPHDAPLECLEIRIRHLQCLVDFLENDLKHVFDLRRDLAAGKITEIAFEDLWHLFNPGDLVVSPTQRQAYRVFHTSGGRPVLSSWVNFEKVSVTTPFRLDCFHMDFDQNRFGPVYEMILIGRFSGKRQIATLNADFYRNVYFGSVPVFPIRFAENPKALVEDLIKRGRRLQNFGKFSYKRFYGSAIIELSPEYEVGELHISSDIIIDLKREGKRISTNIADSQVDPRETAEGCQHYGAARFYDPLEQVPRSGCTCTDIILDEAVDKNRAESYKKDLNLLKILHPNDDITDEHSILLRSVIKAFVLQKRLWLNLPVDFIQDIECGNEDSLKVLEKSGLDDLILPDGHYDLLQALIKGQPNTRIQRASPGPFRGKGQGLLILLHGGPGLGKTSTAEFVAAYTQRPLYPIPFNETSLAANELEKVLECHLDRAQEWNCIVLIDDVDLFLEAAGASKLSSFCHALDNYRGIMILTSRHSNFTSQDVHSRIHVSLHFPAFDQDSTIRVWQKNIDLVRNKSLMNMDSEAEQAILTFAKAEYARGKRWDGRQIRNCFQTAMSLAEYDASKQDPISEKSTNAKSTIIPRPTLTPKILETAAIATGRFVRSVGS